jgi:2-oxoglutarate dehydrogenase E2 component (dihydrolipoamide succinyltransferase)
MGAPTDIRAPIEQEGTRAVVRKWLKRVGDTVKVDEPVVELETDKVAVEVAADAAGVLAEILLEAGADAEPGALLGRLSAEAGQGAKPAAKASAVAAPVAAARTAPASGYDWPSHPKRSIATFDPALRLSPSVRRLLVEAGLDPVGLKGSGRDGRLTRQDVEAALARGGSAPASARPSTVGGVTAIPHDSMRRRIAEHMVHSMTVAPHVTAVFEADFSRIMAHRKAHKAEFERAGVNLTYTAYLVAASAQAMKVSPNVNSRWFEDRLEVYDDANIGLGVALGTQGLIVPVIKAAQSLSLLEIARALQDVTERARAGKLTQADVKGGTFSISNHGVSGSLIATPIIINQPQSAILGVGKLEKRVVVREVDGADAILVRPMAYVSLTIDHRAIDGHQTNAWLTRFVEVLEGWDPHP